MAVPRGREGPRDLHPIFYGSLSWHSCVHGHWPSRGSTASSPARRRRVNPQVARRRSSRPRRYDASWPIICAAVEPRLRAALWGAWLACWRPSSAVRDRGGGERTAALAQLGDAFAGRLEYLPGPRTRSAPAPARTAPSRCAAQEYAAVKDDAASRLLRPRGRGLADWDADAGPRSPRRTISSPPPSVEAEAHRDRPPRLEFTRLVRACSSPRAARASPRPCSSRDDHRDRSDGKIAHPGRAQPELRLVLALAAAALPRRGRGQRPRPRRASGTSTPACPTPPPAGMGEHWLASFALLALGRGYRGRPRGAAERCPAARRCSVYVVERETDLNPLTSSSARLYPTTELLPANGDPIAQETTLVRRERAMRAERAGTSEEAARRWARRSTNSTSPQSSTDVRGRGASGTESWALVFRVPAPLGPGRQTPRTPLPRAAGVPP